MITCNELVKFLDTELKIADFPGDVSNNGLQIEGSDEVRKILFAVDGCLDIFEQAVKNQCDFIFVHHGISWGGGIKRWVNADARRFAALFKNDISLYAAHLPLDANEKFGNNAVLCQYADLAEKEKFFNYAGSDIGFCGMLAKEITLKALAEKVSAPLGGKFLLRGDENRLCRKAAIVSGGGGIDSILEAAEKGCDLLITGEMEHIMHHAALENDVAVIALGHYASETTGPKALMAHVQKNFPGVETVFADSPTGL